MVSSDVYLAGLSQVVTTESKSVSLGAGSKPADSGVWALGGPYN
jgi:hypothetical protein